MCTPFKRTDNAIRKNAPRRIGCSAKRGGTVIGAVSIPSLFLTASLCLMKVGVALKLLQN